MEHKIDNRLWRFPRDAADYAAQYWTIKEAAAVWGVPYRTAVRWVHLHPETAVVTTVTYRNRISDRLAVPFGTAKVETVRGNPYFRYSEWQRANANRRWTKAYLAWRRKSGYSAAMPPCRMPRCLRQQREE